MTMAVEMEAVATRCWSSQTAAKEKHIYQDNFRINTTLLKVK